MVSIPMNTIGIIISENPIRKLDFKRLLSPDKATSTMRQIITVTQITLFTFILLIRVSLYFIQKFPEE